MPRNSDLFSAEHEQQRLKALDAYQILDTPEEPAFDEIVEMASLICDAPIAVINFVDRDRQWFKSVKGLCVRETPLDISICAHAILQPDLFIVPDTTQDPRFANNPLVTGEPHLRFYAGALLKSNDGYPLGTLCVLDYQPRELTERQCFALQALANQVMAHMELIRTHREQAGLIRELEETRLELSKLATTDQLTGLLNRRAFEHRLDQELALIQRDNHPASFIMIDLDHFKTINDTLGHQAGDKVLARFANLCREVFRQADVIGRWGGEEFVVMLPSSSVEEARHAAERLHKRLATTPMLEDTSSPLYITVSLGICLLAGSSTFNDCLYKADNLLYQAKEQGRDRTVYEQPGTFSSTSS
ncbi:sensor domain-containing diguanylate cyclase [Vreelandella arcis]|uniref:diguanylate cyclase n=1 Tax=Vreelandella arcis TaxID=416873 RepID=A0A1H0CT13_9GAMM|nr:sensor domain-containing diguanylate cyclase [Halomonas arcis]SDN61028.1 diguanylate cyclase (GGDEF) domain-containing protein [Halomonas arcis]